MPFAISCSIGYNLEFAIHMHNVSERSFDLLQILHLNFNHETWNDYVCVSNHKSDETLSNLIQQSKLCVELEAATI